MQLQLLLLHYASNKNKHTYIQNNILFTSVVHLHGWYDFELWIFPFVLATIVRTQSYKIIKTHLYNMYMQ